MDEIMEPRIGDVARAALARSVERIVRSDAKLRVLPDAAAIHDARVAVRRLRSDLRTFVPLFDEAWVRDLRDRLSWLQDGLSTARDADVLIEGVHRRSELLPDGDRRRLDAVLTPLGERRDRAYHDVRTMLHDPRYVPLLQTLVGAAKSPPFNARAEEPACDATPLLVAAAWKTLRKRVRRRTRPPSDRELHAIRIAAKRLRYAAEAVEPVVGRRAAAFARAAEKLQTILGEQHDAVTACEKLRSLAGDPERTFLAGELTALEIVADHDARGAWRSAWRKTKLRHRRFTKAS